MVGDQAFEGVLRVTTTRTHASRSATMRLALRYDMRAPSIGAPAPALYAASIEQCAWADRLGFEMVYLAEHHGAEDGYCPSPIVLATAMAARTERMVVHLSALVAVLHHPIRLAEDLAILDIISQGRLAVTLGIGYRPHEYQLFGVEKRRRVPIIEETIGVLQQAWTGEPFEFRGMTVVVRPTPVQRPGPPLYIGGSTEASALRAARLGDGYIPALDGLYEVYAEERRRLGLDVPEPQPRTRPVVPVRERRPGAGLGHRGPTRSVHDQLKRRVGPRTRRRRHSVPARPRGGRPEGQRYLRRRHTRRLRQAGGPARRRGRTGVSAAHGRTPPRYRVAQPGTVRQGRASATPGLGASDLTDPMPAMTVSRSRRVLGEFGFGNLATSIRSDPLPG